MELRAKSLLSWFVLVICALFIVTSLPAQEVNSKQKAIDEFENGNYSKAISLLKQAASENPNDAEIYYYLGYYTHYLCYDSRPLAGYSEKNSDEILEYLHEAIELNPEYGNAYYFIGAEYGSRFRNAMRRRDIKKMRKEIRTGREQGGYPNWLVEYARNMLRACEPNAILFTGGDAEVNPISYLQLIEDYRGNVTVIPVALLNRPPFAMILKDGLKDAIVSAPISWSKEQILDMHPYKWKTNKIEIPISESQLKRYNFPHQHNVMEWELEPDLSSDSRTFLSAGRALLADVIETNRWKRPIYFSLGCRKSYIAGLDKYMQLCGLAYRLLPVEAEKYGLSLNPQKIETVLLVPEHYRYFADVKKHNMPRASRLLNNYRAALLQLAYHYAETENRVKAKEVLDKMEVFMPETIFPLLPGFKKGITNLRDSLESEKR